MNKVKLCMISAKKNRKLAVTMKPTIDLLAEQLLPKFLADNINSYEQVNLVHSLCFLLADKIQRVFNSRIISTIIDQNWDLKGLKQVLVRILEKIGAKSFVDVTHLDAVIKTQNLQSSACIKAMGPLFRKSKKRIDADDLSNNLETYDTDFEFLK